MLLLAATLLQPATKPNIVIIFSDDHARQAISAYGSRLTSTPEIDRLAKNGVRFDRHYTTNPVCAPSRASLLTGKYSHLNGLKDNGSTFDGSQETFPKLLQAAGYRTAVFGKWHLASDPTGFDDWEVLPGQGDYYNPEFLTPKGKVVEKGYVTECITKKALGWIKLQKGKPFFLLVGHKAPHRSWIPGPKQMELFNNRTFPEPATLRTDHESLNTAAKTVKMRLDKDIRPAEDLMVDYVPPRMDSSQQAAWKKAMAPQDAVYHSRLVETGDLLGINYQRYLQQYLRCVAGIDESVGQMYDYLEKYKMLQNTVVIYASDQGFFLGENAWYDKRWCYEPSAGTPFIVRPAGRANLPRVVTSLTSNIDLAPTLLEMAGVTPPKAMQGKSFAPLVKGAKSKTGEHAVYSHFYESDDGDHQAPKYMAITTVRHKLIYYYELNEWELFDLSKDPNETQNLWPSKVKPNVRAELLRKLITRQREIKEDPDMINRVKEAALAFQR